MRNGISFGLGETRGARCGRGNRLTMLTASMGSSMPGLEGLGMIDWRKASISSGVGGGWMGLAWWVERLWLLVVC